MFGLNQRCQHYWGLYVQIKSIKRGSWSDMARASSKEPNERMIAKRTADFLRLIGYRSWSLGLITVIIP